MSASEPLSAIGPRSAELFATGSRTMARGERPWAGAAPPGAVYYFAPDWKEDHIHEHLRQTRGILQADGYKGYAKLYEAEPDGTARFREAACWAHLRRDFHDIWAATKSEIAREALDRIGIRHCA